VGQGRDLTTAASGAHAAADHVRFRGRQVRRDIGRLTVGEVLE
jgi:phosphoribosylamine-glycine ligase